MKIVFNLHNVGLGNNGGSKTIICCAETLAELGHRVVLYSNVINNYSWHEPKGVEIVRKDKCPSSDVVIATGYYSVKNTLACSAPKKFFYIRGYELWQANEQKLLSAYKSLNCIVNSRWLHDHLKKRGIKSKIIYQGIGFDRFYIRDDVNRKKRIGAIYHEKHKTKRHPDAKLISEMSGYPIKLLNKDLQNPSEGKLNKWYNKMSVWVAPTESEGLHNPPMEASLAGCALVCTDHKMSGMQDYAIHDETALVYPARDMKMAVGYVRELMIDEPLRSRLNANMRQLLTDKIGSREHNMKKLVRYIEDH
jgi:hypothetical protein